MPASPTRVLVVGAGAAGSATAILLARAGLAVDLVERAPTVTDTGSGITLQGNALRVLRDLGVLDDVVDAGFAFDVLGLRAPDGRVLAEIPDAHTGGDDLPATVGLPRAVLADLLVGAAVRSGVRARFAVEVTAAAGDGSVTFADGTTARYDLVVGADGLRSTVRASTGVDAEVTDLRMGIWRVTTGRPEDIVRTDLCYGGPAHIAGYCPTGADSLYAYLVEDAREPADLAGLSGADRLAAVRALAAGYGGPWTEIRARMTDPASLNYTWFTAHLSPPPWHRGRVVLVGDAVHSCPPTLAQGAAQALEDAAVLAEELTEAADGWDAALHRYADRRLPRVRTVVDGSVQLAGWLRDREPPVAAGGHADVPGLMARTAALLVERP